MKKRAKLLGLMLLVVLLMNLAVPALAQESQNITKDSVTRLGDSLFAVANTPKTLIIFGFEDSYENFSAWGDDIKASAETFEIVEFSEWVERLSSGLFDGLFSGKTCIVQYVVIPTNLYVDPNVFGAFTNLEKVIFDGKESEKDAFITEHINSEGNAPLLAAKWICADSKAESVYFENAKTDVKVGQSMKLWVKSNADLSGDSSNENAVSNSDSNTFRRVQAKFFTWELSGDKLATLNNGKITFLKAGKLTVTATSKLKPELSASITFNITEDGEIALRSLKIKPVTGKILLKNGKAKLALTPVLRPARTTQTELKWSSSNTKIAKVNQNGVVTFKKAGTVVITCTSVDNPSILATITLKAVKK